MPNKKDITINDILFVWIGVKSGKKTLPKSRSKIPKRKIDLIFKNYTEIIIQLINLDAY